jgi:transcriptional regulator with XRE-family HTH domain
MDKSQFNIQLGVFVKEKRKEFNMSQSDLAGKMDNNFQNISRLERGEVSPTLFWFFKLADAFEMDTSSLIMEFEKFIAKKKK